ncbi:MAG: IclR family transcriptional regulator [Propionicimonas sp.]|uniref:IclR family transcriptional regulator n=1 Tax=Propionicimonas sp. TaxID=1955623 RepID=UPI003D129731
MTQTQAPVVEAVDRALQLLEALADAGPDGASLAQLAEGVGQNKSTAYRALSTLRVRGFAAQDEATGFYRLGPAGFALGDRVYAPQNLAQALHPALVALSGAADELVHLGVLEGDQVLYVDKVEPQRAIRVWSAVGQRVPVASSSLGRALLAARDVPDQALGGYLRALPPDRHVTPERLREAVTDARRRGYSTELGENEPDVACLGTAILRDSAPVAALSITALASRMTDARQAELARLIVREVRPLLPEGLSLLPALASGSR